jgi:hypothetical protein
VLAGGGASDDPEDAVAQLFTVAINDLSTRRF